MVNLATMTLLHFCVVTPLIFAFGSQAQYVSNATSEEWAYAAAVGAVREDVDTTTLGGLSSISTLKWSGITFVDTVGKLFAAPSSADTVLIVDPFTI